MIWLYFALVAATTSTPPAAAAVQLMPRHAAVREALGRRDGALALATLQATTAATTEVPGLYARAHTLTGDRAEACTIVTTSPTGAAQLVNAARCAIEAGSVDTGVAMLATAPREAAVLLVDDDVVLGALETSKSPTVSAVLVPVLERAIPPFDAVARARMARVLSILARASDPAVSARALARLVDDMPEQPAGIAALAAMGAEGQTPAARVRRATTLERMQNNAGVVALVQDLVATDCEAALLVGKAERKLRHYQPARVALQQATPARCGEVTKKARYLEVKVATIQKGATAEKTAQLFIDAYGNDALVDDVLLWLAEIRAARGDVAGERDVLQRLISEHPAGDMVDEARLRLAMRLAEADDVDGARAVFAAAVTSLRGAAKKPVELDRARYWHARLAYAPSLSSWRKAADPREGVTLLTALARERPASFYGRMAAQVVGIEPVTTLTRSQVAPDAAIAVPASLAAQAAWVEARLAARQGFDHEAALLLTSIEGVRELDGAMAVAALFVGVDRADLAHRSLRDRGFALLDDAPLTSSSLARWSLDWPQAWAAPLTAAALEFKVPPPLLIGLSREESAFDASVVSWAGATGLCQLMPPTAKDEARSLKLPAPTTATLVEPTLNARLGASHLGRRLRGMPHPLMAIAAYNAGPGSVAKWMPAEGARVPVDTWVESIPFDETRNYVKKVTGSWVTYSLLDGGAPVVFPLTITGR